MMSHKISYLLLAIAFLALLIPALNCATGPSSDLELQLEKAPRLNEPITLTCVRQTSDFVDKKVNGNISQGNGDFVPPIHEKITLEFERVDPKTYSLIEVPAQEVLVRNNSKWEADITGEPMNFSATVKFPYEGNWAIYAQSTLDPIDKSSIFLNITEDSSSFGWPPDYRPHTSPYPYSPTEHSPITVELDITKPPRLNEPVQLTWSLNSIRDVDGVIGRVEFWYLEGTTGAKVPEEDMLIEGDLTWNGSLKKNSPLHFSATIKFPQEGDWHIHAQGDSFAEQQPINSGSGLYLHIDKDISRWGWTESHETKHGGPPPPTSLPQVR